MNKNISRKKTTFWRVFDLYLGNLISLIRGLVIVPLYLHFINVNLYGAWLASGNILMWLTLFDPGVGDVAVQKIATSYGSKDFENIKFQISSTVIISMIISFIALIIGLLLSNFFIKMIIDVEEIDFKNIYMAFNIGVINAAITLFSFSLSGCILGLQRSKVIGFIRNGAGLIGIIINIYLLYNGAKLLAISLSGMFASLISTLGYLIFLLFIIKKEKIGIGFNYEYVKSYSRIFTYTFLSKLSGTFTRNIDLILVSKFVNLESVPILALSRRALKFISKFVNSFSIAMLPTVSHLYGENNIEKLKRIILDSMVVFALIFILISGGIIIFNKSFMALWVGEKFYIGDFLNLIIAFTFLSSTFSYVVSNFTFSMGAIKENSIFEFIKNVLQMAIMISMAIVYGMKGILIGALLTSLFTEFWFYPRLLTRIINFKFDEIIANFIPIFFILVMLSFIVWLFHQFIINNWYELIGFMIFYVLIFILSVHFIYPPYKKIFKKYFVRNN